MNSAGSGTVPVPANTQIGDLLYVVAVFGANAGADVVTGPSGFTLRQVSAGSNIAGIYVWTKIASGSEPASYTVSHTRAGDGRAKMYAWRNINADPIWDKTLSSASSVTTIPGGAISVYPTVQYLMTAFANDGTTPVLSATNGVDRGGSTTTGLVFLLSDQTPGIVGNFSSAAQASAPAATFKICALALNPTGY